MYIVIGTRPDGREEHLRYETLDEAMQKVRDLVERLVSTAHSLRAQPAPTGTRENPIVEVSWTPPAP